jgi:hypothetical protein
MMSSVCSSVPSPCRKRQFRPIISSWTYPVNFSNARLQKMMGLSGWCGSVRHIGMRLICTAAKKISRPPWPIPVGMTFRPSEEWWPSPSEGPSISVVCVKGFSLLRRSIRSWSCTATQCCTSAAILKCHLNANIRAYGCGVPVRWRSIPVDDLNL